MNEVTKPLPVPRDETREEFIQRCMSDDTMNDEYPDRDQRFAICNQLWEDRNEDSKDEDRFSLRAIQEAIELMKKVNT